jgi:hypothetical protein
VQTAPPHEVAKADNERAHERQQRHRRLEAAGPPTRGGRRGRRGKRPPTTRRGRLNRRSRVWCGRRRRPGSPVDPRRALRPGIAFARGGNAVPHTWGVGPLSRGRSGPGSHRSGPRPGAGRIRLRRLRPRYEAGRPTAGRNRHGLERSHAFRLRRRRVRRSRSGHGRIRGRLRCGHACGRLSDGAPGARGRRRRGRRRRVRRRRRDTRRQQGHRIDVAVVVGREPDAEMDVRSVELRRSARADRRDGHPLVDGLTRTHGERAEVRERDGVSVLRADAQRQPVSRRRAREGDQTSRRRGDGRAGRAAHVDAAMLSSGIRMPAVEREGPEDRPVGRPRPRGGGRRQGDREQDDEGNEPPHELPPVVRFENEGSD